MNKIKRGISVYIDNTCTHVTFYTILNRKSNDLFAINLQWNLLQFNGNKYHSVKVYVNNNNKRRLKSSSRSNGKKKKKKCEIKYKRGTYP